MAELLKITPTRLRVLRYLASRRGGHRAKSVVADCCPRQGIGGRPLHYTAQGLARMTGKVMKPLRDAGLVDVEDWRAPMCSLVVVLTGAGRAVLDEYDKAASAAELAAAIESAA